LKQITILALATLAALHGEVALAATSDEKLRQEAQENSTSGLVFLEVEMIDRGLTKAKACDQIIATVTTDGRNSKKLLVKDAPSFFGRTNNPDYGGAGVLPPGVYTIVQITCDIRLNFNGRFAKFTIRTGEVLNLGRLVIEYIREGFTGFHTRTSVEDLTPDAVQSLTKLAPVAFSKATKRYLVPNPATTLPKAER